MFNDDNTTVIKIRWLTRSELKKIALNGETYDEVIKRLIDHYVKSQTEGRGPLEDGEGPGHYDGLRR